MSKDTTASNNLDIATSEKYINKTESAISPSSGIICFLNTSAFKNIVYAGYYYDLL